MSKKQEEAIDQLISELTFFKEKWNSYTSRDLYDLSDRLSTVETAHIARMTLTFFSDQKKLLEILTTVEKIFFASGDEELSDLGYSYIEDLTTLMANANLEPIELKKYLQPLSSKAYDELMKFWYGDKKYIFKDKKES